MYLLDNAAVREDWNAAKSIVTGTLEKHGAKVLTARRWGERRLAYPINRRNRASFLLTYFELPAESFPAVRRDFELNEAVLRSLELRVDVVPEGEDELHTAEQAVGFSVPQPPDDSHIDEPEEPEREDSYGSRSDRGPRTDKREAETTKEGVETKAPEEGGETKAPEEGGETKASEEGGETKASDEGKAEDQEEAVKASEES